jgi:hypothetical protein
MQVELRPNQVEELVGRSLSTSLANQAIAE